MTNDYYHYVVRESGRNGVIYSGMWPRQGALNQSDIYLTNMSTMYVIKYPNRFSL